MAPTVMGLKACRNFSRAALRYDQLTDLHKQIGKRLIGRIEFVEDFRTLLDVGMGTGWFTHQLKVSFPDAMIIGLDFAPGMVACAGQREGDLIIVQADAAHLPFKEGAFDVIASNLAYQWVEDLPRAFTLCRSRLSQRGVLCLTMFGHDTFHELFTALDTCVDKKNNGNSFTIQRLVDKRQITEALKSAGFHSADVQTERIKVRFPDMMDIIKWIKDIGANALPKNIYIGKDLLLRANEYYNTHFKDSLGIYATLEVIWVEARR